jgi:hypothetical protein
MRTRVGPRHPPRAKTARLAAIIIAVGALCGLVVPLALPDHEGITRAEAGSHHRLLAGTGTARPTPASRHAASPSPRGFEATVTVAANASSVLVPRSYFGLSTEYWALPLFERNMPVFERVLALLHVPGGGPLVLRIGGDSADHSFWHPRWKKMPEWAFALTPNFLSRLGALVRRDHVRLIVDLNLVTDTPLTAAAWARAAETSLPHGSIVGFEVGNEPDIYSRRYWVATIARSPLRVAPLPLALSPSTYVEDFAAYARVLGENAPDIPLIGPAVAHPRISIGYISTLIQDEHSELGSVSGHLYPYSACVRRPRSRSYPTVPRLLSRDAVSAFTSDIASAVAVAHRAGLKFRLTEFNSVTCGGKGGVSNTFATALWAPDALFTALRTGADGANLHVRANAINAPFTVTRSGLIARPLLYGLMLFTRTLGPQARLVRLHLAAAHSVDLSAWAVRVRGGILHVLLIDKGNRTIRVNLHVPATGPATVERLLAPSPYSRSGVTLGGQELNWAGYWSGTPRAESITAGAHGYTVMLPRHSAALMSVRLAPPARRRGHRSRRASEHHGRVAVAKHAILAVRLHRSRKH